MKLIRRLRKIFGHGQFSANCRHAARRIPLELFRCTSCGGKRSKFLCRIVTYHSVVDNQLQRISRNDLSFIDHFYGQPSAKQFKFSVSG